jgi:hypothetical protein
MQPLGGVDVDLDKPLSWHLWKYPYHLTQEELRKELLGESVYSSMSELPGEENPYNMNALPGEENPYNTNAPPEEEKLYGIEEWCGLCGVDNLCSEKELDGEHTLYSIEEEYELCGLCAREKPYNDDELCATCKEGLHKENDVRDEQENLYGENLCRENEQYDQNELCGICMSVDCAKSDSGTVQWVGCEGENCGRWFHMLCLDEKVPESGELIFCPSDVATKANQLDTSQKINGSAISVMIIGP